MQLDNPFFIVSFGAVCTLIPLVLWISQGGTRLMYATLASMLFFGVWLGLERAIETDREAVHRTIYEMRDLVRQNKIEELLQYVEIGAKDSVRGELSRFHFTDCGVSNLSAEPKFWREGEQQRCQIHFVGSATATGAVTGRLGPVKLQMDLKKTPAGKWVVVDYGYKLLGDQTDDYRKMMQVN